MDVRRTGSDAAERARGNSAKNESAYKDVPHVEEELKIGEDGNEIIGHRNRAITFGIYDAEKVEEAVMHDDVAKFQKLNLSAKQILDFNYEISGPKSSA